MQGCVYFCPVSVINVRVLEQKLPTFSGPSRVRRWSPSVSKSVLGLNESAYSQLLIALIDCLTCVCLYLLSLLTIAGIASKVFSDRNDHMETKFSFCGCQRSPTIPATANDRNDHDRWDKIKVYLCDCSDRERSSAIAKS